MNLLQMFMGCMYPGSIRTESIESMDRVYPDYRFQVANIDERGNEVSKGELQLTDRDLIYFRPTRFPTRWPIGYIRRYGCTEQGTVFLFEAGRRCPTGEAIFAFRLNQGSQLVEKLSEKIENFQPNEDQNNPQTNEESEGADPRPLSYALIDFDTTKALKESAQAHAASRVK